MISDGVCFVMFYVSVLTKKKQADSLSGEPWNPLTFLNIVEVVIDEGTRFNSFEPVKTCQNHKRRQNWFPDLYAKQLKDIQCVSFWQQKCVCA